MFDLRSCSKVTKAILYIGDSIILKGLLFELQILPQNVILGKCPATLGR